MTRSVLKTILTSLALVLLFAGSFNMNGSANAGTIDDDVTDPKIFCRTYCPIGGPYTCATLILPDGTKITCGGPQFPTD
jgi:hypothetical protein